MSYLFFLKVNLTICLVHINSDEIVNRQGNPFVCSEQTLLTNKLFATNRLKLAFGHFPVRA